MQPVTIVTGQRIPSGKRHVKRTPDTRLIRKALIDKNWSMTGLARAAELGRAYTSLVVHGHRRNQVAQRRIATALGVGMERAFPRAK